MTLTAQQSRRFATRAICNELLSHALPWERPDAHMSLNEVRASFAKIQDMRHEDGDHDEDLWLAAVAVQRIVDGLDEYPRDRRYGTAMAAQGVAILRSLTDALEFSGGRKFS